MSYNLFDSTVSYSLQYLWGMGNSACFTANSFVKHNIPKKEGEHTSLVLIQSITVSPGLILVTLQDFASKI